MRAAVQSVTQAEGDAEVDAMLKDFAASPPLPVPVPVLKPARATTWTSRASRETYAR